MYLISFQVLRGRGSAKGGGWGVAKVAGKYIDPALPCQARLSGVGWPAGRGLLRTHCIHAMLITQPKCMPYIAWRKHSDLLVQEANKTYLVWPADFPLSAMWGFQ